MAEAVAASSKTNWDSVATLSDHESITESDQVESVAAPSGHEVITESDHEELFAAPSDRGSVAESDQEESFAAPSDRELESNQASEYPHSNAYNADPCSAVFQNDLLLLAFKIRHKLTNEAMADLTRLCIHLSGNECVSKSMYFFDKQFETATTDFDFYYLCDVCKIYVNDTHTSKLQCSNPTCRNPEVKKRNRNTFFAYLPIANQLKDLLENHNVERLLNFGLNCPGKMYVNNWKDIYDGVLYKNSLGGANLSLSFNADGVPVFKSSSCGIWPILCTVNELPPDLRKDHVLLAALWFGESKPAMNVFFQPFVDEIRKLNDVGFSWTRSDKSIVVTKVKAILLLLLSVP